MNYYYSIDGAEVVGPYLLEDLKGYLLSGALPQLTQVCAEGTELWQPLTSLVAPTPPSSPCKPPSLQAPCKPPSRQRAKVVEEASIAKPAAPKAVYTMQGVQDLLEVFPDKVSIMPKGVLGFLNKGLKGTKTIPFTSITAIQFKDAGLITSGFLQFTIPGGNESRGGLFAATQDENTFMFRETSSFSNAESNRAREIKEYIEAKVQEARLPRQTATPNLSDELQKLAKLNTQGVLSDNEFLAAKRRLLS